MRHLPLNSANPPHTLSYGLREYPVLWRCPYSAQRTDTDVHIFAQGVTNCPPVTLGVEKHGNSVRTCPPHFLPMVLAKVDPGASYAILGASQSIGPAVRINTGKRPETPIPAKAPLRTDCRNPIGDQEGHVRRWPRRLPRIGANAEIPLWTARLALCALENSQHLDLIPGLAAPRGVPLLV
jgi:hypothetical protein